MKMDFQTDHLIWPNFNNISPTWSSLKVPGSHVPKPKTLAFWGVKSLVFFVAILHLQDLIRLDSSGEQQQRQPIKTPIKSTLTPPPKKKKNSKDTAILLLVDLCLLIHLLGWLQVCILHNIYIYIKACCGANPPGKYVRVQLHGAHLLYGLWFREGGYEKSNPYVGAVAIQADNFAIYT